MKPRVAAVLAALALLGLADRAHALDLRELYEESLVARALVKHGLVVDPAPGNKVIERVVIEANKIILPSDLPLAGKIPWPLLNKLHTRTRDYIIVQELLFSVGQRFEPDVFEESGRNLRRMFILAVARLVVCRGSSPDQVVIMVVTKDQWSLRLNTDFAFDQARLDTLSFSLSESNLAGRNKTASVAFALDPGRYLIGGGYSDPRLGGSRHALSLAAGVYLNRDRSNFEGAYANASIGRPLYSLRTRWAWTLSLSYLEDIVRQFRGGDLAVVVRDSNLIPFVYRERRIAGVVNVTRSFGVVNKLNITLGFRVDSALYRTPVDFPEVGPAAAASFRALLPRSEDSAGPYVALDAFSARYLRLQNIDTYALSEDFRIGPSVQVVARAAHPAFGFSSQFLNLSVTYSDTRYVRGDLMSFSASAGVRLQDGVWPGTSMVNEDLTLSVRNVTPKFGPFRLHVFASIHLRGHDLDSLRLTLGSDSGLRAYGPRALIGNDRYQLNVELRTAALNFWTLHVGGVLFYDAGDAPANLQSFGWKQGAGVGLRILIPQFNHDVVRLDLAFPFELPAGGYVPRFSASFGQAF